MLSFLITVVVDMRSTLSLFPRQRGKCSSKRKHAGLSNCTSMCKPKVHVYQGHLDAAIKSLKSHCANLVRATTGDGPAAFISGADICVRGDATSSEGAPCKRIERAAGQVVIANRETLILIVDTLGVCWHSFARLGFHLGACSRNQVCALLSDSKSLGCLLAPFQMWYRCPS